MVHPFYQQARGWVGRTVLVHHLNGHVYRGTLIGVEPHGVYVVRQPAGTRLMSGQRILENHSNLAELESDIDVVYAPASYFAFGALAGLTLGAVAGGMYW